MEGRKWARENAVQRGRRESKRASSSIYPPSLARRGWPGRQRRRADWKGSRLGKAAGLYRTREQQEAWSRPITGLGQRQSRNLLMKVVRSPYVYVQADCLVGTGREEGAENENRLEATVLLGSSLPRAVASPFSSTVLTLPQLLAPQTVPP